MRKIWWKVLCVLLLGYSIVGGFLMPVPALPIIHESIRNLYFHVPMWFGMMFLFGISLVYAIRYLRSGNLKDDIFSLQFINIGLVFGCLGLVTGMEWANFTWGEPWSNDPKQLGAALSILTYFAYLALRGALPDFEKRARISAVYNIFAFALMIPFIWILPSLTDSLHPGSGGNTGFNTYDLDNGMRMVFYPAVSGWILFGVWMATLVIRVQLIEKKELLHI
ncbi:MAG: cytochrome c biogenesis protein CcsA [Edaphocola sp.]